MDRIINMVIRQVVGRLVRVGMDKGIDAMSRKRGGDPDAPVDPAIQRQNAETKKRANQAMRLGRRMTRM